MEIDKVFNEVSEKMRADLQRARGALSHAGMKGASTEDTFRAFLREYLPRSLDVSSGVLVDATGKTSRQLDAIISDAAKTPVFFKSGEDRVIPVECAYAVIEVKSRLDTKELEGALENMLSVRALSKAAYYKPLVPVLTRVYGQEWEILPTSYFVFAFESMDPIKLLSRLETLHEQHGLPEWSRIDCVCVLDKGVIFNMGSNGMFDALPEPGSKLVFTETDRALLWFYSLMSRHFNQASMPDFNLSPYLSKLTFGRVFDTQGRISAED